MTDILRLALPFTVWLATFSAVYGLHGLICSDRWTASQIGSGILLAGWGLALAAQIALFFVLRSSSLRSQSQFGHQTGQYLAVAAILANLWALFPVAATSSCAALPA